MKQIPILLFILLLITTTASCKDKGSQFITSHGYENCIEISNGTTRVVLEPNCGGRVLVYEYNGVNALYINPVQNGFISEPGVWNDPEGKHLSAGRFDVGPEKIKPDTKLFWYGKWDAEITGEYSARLTSQVSETEHLQLVRDFVLDAKSSRLIVTQTIKNLGDTPRKLCYWSRTFGTGGGIAIVPLSNPNRFPKGYLSYDAGNVIRYMPEPEENIQVSDDYLLILGPTQRPKFVIDSDKGWLGYITTDNLLFIKKYDYSEAFEYGEMAAVPLSVWYNGNEMTELEPIGPWEWIEAGKSTSYSETWFLYPYNYPANKDVNLSEIKEKVDASN